MCWWLFNQMTTPVLITNWAAQSLSANGGGLVSSTSGTGNSISTTIYRNANSPQSYQCTTSSSTSLLSYTQVSGAGVIVGRVYLRFNGSLPTTASNPLNLISGQGADTTWAEIGFVPSTGKLAAFQYTETPTDGPVVTYDVWYRIDFRFTWNSTTHTIDWKVDGVDQPQFSIGSQTSTTFSSFRIGNTGGVNSTGTWNFCDLVLSVTSADYAIGAGGTQTLVPAADGTHSLPAANEIEAQDGTDIGTGTTAYDKINSMPPSATTYIRQATSGPTAYAEVLFGDISDTHTGIIGAMAFLAYTSETTTNNRGGCIVSKDSFSTQTTLHGAPSATVDYSDGSTSNLYYKSAIVSGVTDDTTVNALKARVGYSDDATPDPYWIDVYVEVAYTAATSTQLVVQDGAHSHAADNIALTQHNALAVAEASHAHAADNLSLTQHNILSVQEASHGHSVDNVVLVITLIVSDALHSHAADSLALTQHSVLVIQEASHSHTVDNLVLVSGGILDIQEATHSHSADAPSLTQHNILVIAESGHAHAVDNLSLVPLLEIAEGLHGHSADNLSLTQHSVLSLQEAGHAHAADNVVLDITATLVIQSASHTHSADNMALTVSLIIAATFHVHTSDRVNFSGKRSRGGALGGHRGRILTIRRRLN